MKKNITVIEGDGIGPEIMKQTIKILNAIEKKYHHEFFYEMAMAGFIAMKKFGDPMPKKTIDSCLKSNAILFGCIGDPDGDKYLTGMRPEDGLLKIRKEMGLYCNIRPIISYPKVINKSPIKNNLLDKVNFIIYRELTGGIYFGKKGRSKNGESAYDHCLYSKKEIRRIGKLALQAANSRNKKLTVVDKANVLETSRLWREVIHEISFDYPDVILEFLYIDNAAMQIIFNPKKFDVILTDNMFGDILSDESSVIAGSLGLLPSASIGNKTPIFEPIHGSYPEAKGKNIANPLGSILSSAMMLEYFGLYEEKKIIEKAVSDSIEKNVCTQDIIEGHITPSTTDEVGSYIEKYILNQ
ncbi:3-isopropylmalate dehydrogenase [Blattabacterium cuenoti]|uniref:3-isopropylmalate dehydrogenase n=1 Tax=Blattabacterium cuenoti TaxID=1653831 RepID=UPI00163BDBA6|nr:3-isopropylmalate dehydrogenase [Blattabacterium cuenoti]